MTMMEHIERYWKRILYAKTKIESVQLGHLLRSPIFVEQKAESCRNAVSENGVEFSQKSIEF